MTKARQIAMHFDGKTIREDPDAPIRLTTMLGRVLVELGDGEWHTIAQLQAVAGGMQTSISARLRDLRKPKFGARRVERKLLHNGLYIYRLVVDEDGVPGAPRPALVATAVRG